MPGALEKAGETQLPKVTPDLVAAAKGSEPDRPSSDTPVREVDPTVGRHRKPSGPRPLRAGSVQWEPDLTAKLRVLCAQEDLTRRAVHNTLLRYLLSEAPKDVRRQLITDAKTWERQQKGLAQP